MSQPIPRLRLVAAWTLVAVAVVPAVFMLVPPATMLLVKLAILTLEESPLFAMATAIAIPVVYFLAPQDRRRQRIAMFAVLGLALVLELRPFISMVSLKPSAGFSATRALRGDTAKGPLTERWIDYAADDGSPLRMLLVRGEEAGPLPTMVVVYGGAWRGGDATQAIDVSRYFARRGYTVAAVDYRHAPQHRFPAQIDDVNLSLALLSDSSTAWGIDTTRVAIVGRSAGGHLAMLAAFGTPLVEVHQLTIRAVVALYAPWDLAKAYYDRPRPDPIDVRQILRNFIGGPPNEQAAAFHDASPSSYVRSDLPPALLIYAGRDHLVMPKFGRAADSALRSAGNDVQYVELSWAEHGFDLLPNGIGSQQATSLIAAFLEAKLR